MTPYPKVAALIDKWHSQREVTVADMLQLDRTEREAFYGFLSPANETRLRIEVTNFLQSKRG